MAGLLPVILYPFTETNGRFSPECNKLLNNVSGPNDEYQQKKVTSGEESDLLEIWRPQPDLNRRRRRERAVSWAGLDDGDA